MNPGDLYNYKQFGKAASLPVAIALSVIPPVSNGKTFVEYENVFPSKYRDFPVFINPCSFTLSDINKVNSAFRVESSHEKIEAPLWLKRQMEALHLLPPPTLEKVRTQFKASAEARMRLDGKAKI